MNTSFWRDRPVLVTGCTGLLGSWLTQTLVEAGADVVGLIRDDVPQSHLVRSGVIERIRVACGDVTDYVTMERVLNEYEIDTVFHLAAQTIVGIANRAPLSTFETNVRGTWITLEAARRVSSVKRILVASSDKAYGTQPILPYTEDMPLHGEHPYDVSKSAADLIAQTYARTYNMPIAITRCANLYGGGDLNWNRLIPGTIRSALQGKAPIIRSDGTFVRDYLYVRDAVRAYMMLAEALDRPDIRGQAFNCSTDEPMSVLEMTRLILSLSPHPRMQPIVLNEVKNEIKDQYLNSAKIEAAIGWQPAWSREAALVETLAWYAQYLGYKLKVEG
ncbi:MAG TPA: GDP-mannose 4,6-dehydratase [Anaerolineae bacterium]|nr:GDP-mannose 4,6-dehydratase [Anaerolineae bacterium]HQI83087.1 GDP-mannose 4,6-dehydratase [Anaerolineae bacterium]